MDESVLALIKSTGVTVSKVGEALQNAEFSTLEDFIHLQEALAGVNEVMERCISMIVRDELDDETL